MFNPSYSDIKKRPELYQKRSTGWSWPHLVPLHERKALGPGASHPPVSLPVPNQNEQQYSPSCSPTTPPIPLGSEQRQQSIRSISSTSLNNISGHNRLPTAIPEEYMGKNTSIPVDQDEQSQSPTSVTEDDAEKEVPLLAHRELSESPTSSREISSERAASPLAEKAEQVRLPAVGKASEPGRQSRKMSMAPDILDVNVPDAGIHDEAGTGLSDAPESGLSETQKERTANVASISEASRSASERSDSEAESTNQLANEMPAEERSGAIEGSERPVGHEERAVTEVQVPFKEEAPATPDPSPIPSVADRISPPRDAVPYYATPKITIQKPSESSEADNFAPRTIDEVLAKERRASSQRNRSPQTKVPESNFPAISPKPTVTVNPPVSQAAKTRKGKLVLRKMRNAAARRTILKATLGRQLAVPAKEALRRLAKGENVTLENLSVIS